MKVKTIKQILADPTTSPALLNAINAASLLSNDDARIFTQAVANAHRRLRYAQKQYNEYKEILDFFGIKT